MPQQLEYVEDDSGWDKDFVPQPAIGKFLGPKKDGQHQVVGARDQDCGLLLIT